MPTLTFALAFLAVGIAPARDHLADHHIRGAMEVGHAVHLGGAATMTPSYSGSVARGVIGNVIPPITSTGGSADLLIVERFPLVFNVTLDLMASPALGSISSVKGQLMIVVDDPVAGKSSITYYPTPVSVGGGEYVWTSPGMRVSPGTVVTASYWAVGLGAGGAFAVPIIVEVAVIF